MRSASDRRGRYAFPAGSSSRARHDRAAREERLRVRSSVLLPGVESLSALVTEFPVRDEPAKQRRGFIRLIAERRMQMLGDGEPDVQADDVGEPQRTHWMVVSQL